MSESELSDLEDTQFQSLSPVPSSSSSSASAASSSVPKEKTTMEDKMDYLTNLVERLQEELRQKGGDSNSRKRKRTEKQEISLDCAEAARRIYIALKGNDDFRGFDLKERCSSAHNTSVCDKVWGELLARYDNKWTQAMVFAALRRYHKSLADDERRRGKGTAEAHKIRAKRRNTRVAKRKRRLAALKAINWPTHRVDRVQPVLEDLNFISSDEEGNAERKEKRTRILSWESEKLSKYKLSLDNYFLKKMCTLKQVRMMYRQVKDDTCDKSCRPAPDNAATWTIKKDDVGNQSLDDSRLSIAEVNQTQ